MPEPEWTPRGLSQGEMELASIRQAMLPGRRSAGTCLRLLPEKPSEIRPKQDGDRGPMPREQLGQSNLRLVGLNKVLCL
jgi:hypothetical protein